MISIFQLNSHNANQANTEITTQLAEHPHPTIALLQEPYLNKGRIQYPAGCTKLEQHKNPRTAIYITKTLNFSLLPSLSNQYATTIAGNINGQKIVISSIYLHHKLTPTPDWLDKIISYSKHNNYGLLIGSDCNAHSNLWGPEPKHKDPRGENLEEFILKHNLKLENIGTTPTFRNSRNFTSNIDITLSYNLKTPISHWQVHDNINNYSDHNTISYKINSTPLKPTFYRPWDKCDWTAFHSDLLTYKLKFPELITQKILDDKTSDITNILTKHLDKHCKKRQIKTNISQFSWHNKQLKKERNLASKAYRLWQSDYSNINLANNYKQLNKNYRKSCKQAKSKKHKDIISSLNDYGETSKYYKDLINATTYDIRVLQTPTTETKPGRDTIKHLYDTHFPAHTKPKKNVTNHFKQLKSKELPHLYKDLITADKVKHSLTTFEHKKIPRTR